MSAGCPLGGPRCPEAICDCFIDFCAGCDAGKCDQGGIHPEFFIVGGTEHGGSG